MAFDDVRLPIEVERGATGGPGFLTNVLILQSGKEQRNSLWSVDRGRWDIAYGIQTREEALAVRDFFYARAGRARGFRFRDWSNYTTFNIDTQTHTPQVITPAGDGANKIFQMYYRYVDTASFAYTKQIYKPVASTIKVYVNAVESAPSNWSLNATTGVITFVTAPAAAAVLTWTGEFDLPVRFDTDELQIAVTTKNLLTFPSLPIVELKL